MFYSFNFEYFIEIIHYFLDKGDVAFITYEKGEAEAKIRFKTENFAKPIAEKWTETEELKEHKVEAALLEVIEHEIEP